MQDDEFEINFSPYDALINQEARITRLEQKNKQLVGNLKQIALAHNMHVKKIDSLNSRIDMLERILWDQSKDDETLIQDYFEKVGRPKRK
jgi:hypothetical protein|tara:strand:+ start:143 stop:412 length:270 start_codon:yes stop_codon:yes gene_type:complete